MNNYLKKINEAHNTFFLKMEEKSGIDSEILALINGMMWGIMIRAIICKKYNINFWLPGFVKK